MEVQGVEALDSKCSAFAFLEGLWKGDGETAFLKASPVW